MGQALYRRYRSKSLAEVIGQEHITHTLGNALKRNAIGHAYLLTGPRGVGKTSIARILAHNINDLPYEAEQTHLDIIEIDAASNRRIDEIRDLREKVHTAPSSAKYKVYIIDEVHMLTKEAFNALLKTLEEPPKHVVFILATTDVHKLPDTIISRTQHFTFKPIHETKIVEHLRMIAQAEKIKIDDESLQIIAHHGKGSFRDSIGLLEQAAGISDDVKGDDVRLMLGVPPAELINQLAKAYWGNSIKEVISILSDLSLQGFLAEEIAAQLSSHLRSELIAGKVNDVQQISQLLAELIEVPASREPKTLLEIVIIKNMHASSPVAQESQVSLPDKKESVSKKNVATLVHTKHDVQAQDLPKTEPISPKPATKPKSIEKTEKHPTVDDDVWQSVLERLKKSHSTLYSVARMAEFQTNGKDIKLSFKFAFHKKRMETTKHKAILDELLAELCSAKPIVEFILLENKQKEETRPTEEPKENPLEAISNIFGGGEVLES